MSTDRMFFDLIVTRKVLESQSHFSLKTTEVKLYVMGQADETVCREILAVLHGHKQTVIHMYIPPSCESNPYLEDIHSFLGRPGNKGRVILYPTLDSALQYVLGEKPGNKVVEITRRDTGKGADVYLLEKDDTKHTEQGEHSFVNKAMTKVIDGSSITIVKYASLDCPAVDAILKHWNSPRYLPAGAEETTRPFQDLAEVIEKDYSMPNINLPSWLQGLESEPDVQHDLESDQD